ncbi:polysaccharide biosynthesis/export family protein [Paracraurococcus ruber]|uniref:Polysialic acid transport protein KpsD n=1 Tax=Paracraurococcus ruber TaxID=77675 RepID=A0ABS1CVZ4_9PROT|nr:polysaccharide biosynthesis/export family protein [Paracraurococcus ruber]MBK1658207.1 polysialic acid transport protein KpsD [Paracraurococcus ruber]TDG18463.1 polysialic acid transport protein KpsD [Paracraurococcus ruber]
MRREWTAAFAAGLLLAGPAAAQSPIQSLQQRQALQLLQSQPTTVQQLPTLVDGDRTLNRQGSETQSEAGPGAVNPLGDPDRGTNATAVFGAALFTRDAPAISDAPNPSYLIVPGDRISVRVWGAVDAEVATQVDPSGMIFLPNIGPIRVAGTAAGALQRVVEQEVRRVFTSQVQVYAVLLSTSRVGVFVTGHVRVPGRYAGSAADSVLDFLVRAGGVDPSRGSYRDITLQRGGSTIASIDLYRFLREGRLPQVRLQEGDTLVVARQRALVGAEGAVRNNYLFEVPARSMTGQELLDYARPLPAATNVVVKGTRGGQPYSRYATLAEFRALPLQDQDVATFITDAPARTVRVTVEGSRIGPSVLVADRDAQLCQVLDHVAVDPVLADTRSVFLLRPSVAAQQRRAIDEALDRLERQLFLAVSPTTGVAAIRASEANLVSSYIQRARRTQPEGRLVVVDSGGRCAPVRLEDGDVIVIPEKSQTVLVAGEVTAPRAVVWRPEMRIEDYIRAAGGYAARGSDSALMIRRASGELVLEPNQPPRPGDELIALPRLDPKAFQIGSDLLGLIYQVAVSTRIFL